MQPCGGTRQPGRADTRAHWRSSCPRRRCGTPPTQLRLCTCQRCTPGTLALPLAVGTCLSCNCSHWPIPRGTSGRPGRECSPLPRRCHRLGHMYHPDTVRALRSLPRSSVLVGTISLGSWHNLDNRTPLDCARTEARASRCTCEGAPLGWKAQVVQFEPRTRTRGRRTATLVETPDQTIRACPGGTLSGSPRRSTCP